MTLLAGFAGKSLARSVEPQAVCVRGLHEAMVLTRLGLGHVEAVAGPGPRMGICGFGAATHIIAQVAVYQGRQVLPLRRQATIRP